MSTAKIELDNRNIEIENYYQRGFENLTVDEIQNIEKNIEYYSQDFITKFENHTEIIKKNQIQKTELKNNTLTFDIAETKSFNKAAVPFYVIAFLTALAIIVFINLNKEFSLFFGIAGIVLFLTIGLLIAKYKSKTLIIIGLVIYVIDAIYTVSQIGLNWPYILMKFLMISWIAQTFDNICKMYDLNDSIESSNIVKNPENQINVSQIPISTSSVIDDETKETIRTMFMEEAYKFVREKFNVSLKDAKKIVKEIKSTNKN